LAEDAQREVLSSCRVANAASLSSCSVFFYLPFLFSKAFLSKCWQHWQQMKQTNSLESKMTVAGALPVVANAAISSSASKD